MITCRFSIAALLLFSGDKRFDDHVNCYADIFNISQKEIVDDFVVTQFRVAIGQGRILKFCDYELIFRDQTEYGGWIHN